MKKLTSVGLTGIQNKRKRLHNFIVKSLRNYQSIASCLHTSGGVSFVCPGSSKTFFSLFSFFMADSGSSLTQLSFLPVCFGLNLDSGFASALTFCTVAYMERQNWTRICMGKVQVDLKIVHSLALSGFER